MATLIVAWDSGRESAWRSVWGSTPGSCVVGEMGGSGRRQEQLALGDTPNITAPLRDWQHPNTIVVAR